MRTCACVFLFAAIAAAEPPDPAEVLRRDRAIRDAYEKAPVALSGRVVTEDGRPARATVFAGNAQADCDATGAFRFEGLPRRNLLLVVRQHGCYDEVRAACLAVRREDPEVAFGTVRLRARSSDRLRLVFGGDAMMGRRFLSPDTVESPEQPHVRLESAWEDSRRVMREVVPLLRAADITVVNLETVISDRLMTPISQKEHSFRSPSAMVEALRWAGVDAVTLGNNHSWDYGSDGFRSTVEALGEFEIAWCGAGDSEADARRGALLRTSTHALRLLSYSGIVGTDVPLQASGDRGGAARMAPKPIAADVIRHRRESAPVVVAIHTGTEYADDPTRRAREAARAAADTGALLVVGTHPHAPQGLAWEDRTLVAWSLGNLVFDQSRWEALPGLLLVVDLEGKRLDGARLIPIISDDYRPRPATGELARREIRRVASLSPGVRISWDAGAGEITGEVAAAAVDPETVELAADVPWRLAPRGTDAWLERLEGPEGAELEAGSDLLRFGGFEDEDVDRSLGETGAWTAGPGARISFDRPHSGASCLLLARAADAHAVATLRYRVPVPGMFTVTGVVRSGPDGAVRVEADWCAEGSLAPFATESLGVVAPGDGTWSRFSFDVRRPREARALRIRVAAVGPGTAPAWVDDLALVAWTPARDLPARNTFTYVRSSRPGRLRAHWSAGIR